MSRQRWSLVVGGLVQGVGFRPFVYRLAQQYSLVGRVCNNAAGVEIELEGPENRLAAFLRDLERKTPPAAIIERLESRELALAGDDEFVIADSAAGSPPTAGVVPDLALCADCWRELEDPADHRYLYPFINCTNCGPRYTIIEQIPYDRPHTSMRAFTMCSRCQAEYDDPASRRFHAQPNACPVCGPRLSLVTLSVSDHEAPHLAAPLDRLSRGPRDQLPLSDREQNQTGTDSGGAENQAAHILSPVWEGQQAVAETRRRLLAGEIIAVKGIGGFHLAVNAADQEALLRLRRRKGRLAKPLAVMVCDLATARQLVHLCPAEEKLLLSPARPIVLAPRSTTTTPPVAAAVAPGHHRLGLMLAYAPLHYLLLGDDLPVLVMTSANPGGEPLCTDNDEACRRLAGIADAVLLHDREIVRGNDDSVVLSGADERDGALPPLVIRRGRGYAPGLLPFAEQGPAILAVGGELKNTVCLAADGRAVVSQHLGDLQNLESYRVFCQTIADLRRLFAIEPQMVALDLHPDYLASRWARQWAAERGLPVLAVQHHHAHMASCLAENEHHGPALGLILDGTGYGPDHTIWGGEILLGDLAGFSRWGQLETMPLPGGDLAIRQPWRAAVGYLYQAFGGEPPALPFLAAMAADGVDWRAILPMLRQNINSPRTSSCGRLFDAVAAMAGGCREISYEAQAAVELMQAAAGPELPPLVAGKGGQAEVSGHGLHPFAYQLLRGEGRLIIGISQLIREVAAAVAAGAGRAEISRRFHATLVDMFTAALVAAAEETDIKTVALSGGVMQNEILLAGLRKNLAAAGLTVLLPRRLPPNDGGLAYGQAVAAAAQWQQVNGK
ncbi:carbamoyltransferase HypF [Desulfurivibrio alkaliphilus]|nr:carbamoyltransferase HypF [Desulfurivibrio alkaliphilus]MDF1614460.1 carbamoyltransferase HypF [Desulfurivibrio alkaliphilus]